MPPASQNIEFEGYFAKGVLGIFKIIRGFVDLRDLAAVSIPYKLSAGVEPGRVVGYQRQLDEKHALNIKKYLEQSDYRLMPEVILSVRGAFNNATEQERVIGVESEEGGTFPIHPRMYEAIASSDIIICDLTGHRPNVFVEAGYALKHHEKNRLIFLFEPVDDQDRIPFDLTTFKYISISQAAEIPNKIKAEIIAILRDAGAPL